MKRTLSDFIRNATPSERAEVYAKVISGAITRQREALGCFCQDTKGESCAICTPLKGTPSSFRDEERK